MLLLILGLVLFLGTHSVPIVAADFRARGKAAIGERPWKLAFGAVSLLGLVLIVLGYGAARQAPDALLLYVAPFWLRHVALLLMLPVFVLLLAAYLPGRIQRATRHPMLLAVKLWAVAHLLANGTLADLLLFGSFLGWAVADRISLKRRAPEQVPGAPASPRNDWIALGGGLALYVAFLLWLHKLLMGVSPLG
jgi:uncharacterized membrane protein